jgi:hypothetical protein
LREWEGQAKRRRVVAFDVVQLSKYSSTQAAACSVVADLQQKRTAIVSTNPLSRSQEKFTPLRPLNHHSAPLTEFPAEIWLESRREP